MRNYKQEAKYWQEQAEACDAQIKALEQEVKNLHDKYDKHVYKEMTRVVGRDEYEFRIYQDYWIRKTDYMNSDGHWGPQSVVTFRLPGFLWSTWQKAETFELPEEVNDVVACMLEKNFIAPLEGKPGPSTCV